MLDYLGEKKAAVNIVNAIEKTLAIDEGRTKDLKGTANTLQCANVVLKNI
jgi:tartrate dehydrogenase/decarboxylase/D-malate dehydrogenase